MKFILEKSKYLSLIGVIALLFAAVAAFAWGTLKTVNTISLVVTSLGRDKAITVEFIEIVDSFLIATALLIFAVSLYELFIDKLDLPEWTATAVAHNLHELKAKLSSMVVLVMGVKFLEKLLDVKDAAGLMQIGIATALMSAALIAFGYFGNKD